MCRLERLAKGRVKTPEEKASGALETAALNRIQAALEAEKPARSVPLKSVSHLEIAFTARSRHACASCQACAFLLRSPLQQEALKTCAPPQACAPHQAIWAYWCIQQAAAGGACGPALPLLTQNSSATPRRPDACWSLEDALLEEQWREWAWATPF